MKILINKAIGTSRMQIEIDERQDKEALLKATFFLAPDVCGLCVQPTNVIWEGRRTKGDTGTFTYISRRCLKCTAQSTMGEYKDGGFFWKKWEIYRGEPGGHDE